MFGKPAAFNGRLLHICRCVWNRSISALCTTIGNLADTRQSVKPSCSRLHAIYMHHWNPYQILQYHSWSFSRSDIYQPRNISMYLLLSIEYLNFRWENEISYADICSFLKCLNNTINNCMIFNLRHVWTLNLLIELSFGRISCFNFQNKTIMR